MAILTATVTERLQVSHGERFATTRVATVRELVIARGTLSRTLRRSVVLRDRVAIHHVAAVRGGYAVLLRSTLSMRSALSRGIAVILRSNLALHGSLKVGQGIILRDKLRVVNRLTPQAHYGVALRSTLKLTGTLSKPVLAMLLRSTLAIRGTPTGTRAAVAALDARLALSATLTPRLLLTVVSHDNLHLTATQALRGIYSGRLKDTVDFVVDVIDPSGDVTTWAMNTRTGAVTEYLDYSFAAFAASANGAYLGAADDGLYELVGADDNGTPVVADIISGLTNFSGEFLSGMKAAYLGVRGKGQFYLKLVDGSGKTYVYGVQADNQRVSRVNLGKGLRAKYFTWELLSTGQDFNLQSVTFIPIQSVRRV